jgi:hypothetical protein
MERDEICVYVKLNYSEKVKGAYLEEDAPLSDTESALPQVITRRVLWRVAQSQYELLGLLSVYIVRWKLLMRRVTLKGKGGGWESALDKEEEDEFRNLLRDLDVLRKIRFPRCVQPLESQFKKPMLLIFGDGVERSMLHTGVPKMGKRGWYGVLQTGDRQNPGGPQGKNNNPKNGIGGSSQFGETSKKDEGGTEDTIGRNEVLHRLVSSPGYAQNRIWQVQLVRGSKSERGQSEQQHRGGMEVARREL